MVSDLILDNELVGVERSAKVDVNATTKTNIDLNDGADRVGGNLRVPSAGHVKT